MATKLSPANNKYLLGRAISNLNSLRKGVIRVTQLALNHPLPPARRKSQRKSNKLSNILTAQFCLILNSLTLAAINKRTLLRAFTVRLFR